MVEAWGPVYPPLRYPSYPSGLNQSPNSFIILVPFSLQQQFTASPPTIAVVLAIEVWFVERFYEVYAQLEMTDGCFAQIAMNSEITRLCLKVSDFQYFTKFNLIFNLD